jgi:hypothetical protein
MINQINDPKTLDVVQDCGKVPYNIGSGEVISFPEGWIIKAVGRSWLVRPADATAKLSTGPIKFAIHPDHIYLTPGGDGLIDRHVRQGGREFLRVIGSERIWWVSEYLLNNAHTVYIQPDLKHAFFFDQDGRRIYLVVICAVKRNMKC